MTEESYRDKDLSEISTLWTDVKRHDDSDSQLRLLRRYERAIKRYVVSSVGDPSEADDLFQRFAVRFLQGDFHRADPERGRFRDYLKTALFHLVRDYHRERTRFPASIPDGFPEPPVQDEQVGDDALFLDCWRRHLLDRGWQVLEEVERRSDRPVYTILRLSCKTPRPPSAEIAAMLSLGRGVKITEQWVRKVRKEARKIFREAIVHEVRESLRYPTREMLEEELIDLGLYEQCFKPTRRGA